MVHPRDGAGLARYLDGWEPPEQVSVDALPPEPAVRLARLLDQDPPPGPLPPLWHYLYFLDWPRHADLGADGHPREGAFLPPVPGRRRMFTGGRLRVARPLRCGEPAQRCSRLVRTEVKAGRSGELLFVTVRHEISQAGRTAVVEEQDLAYRQGDAPPRAPAPQAGTGGPTSDAPWQLPFRADPVLLFRFSALSANAHRIHYDAPHAASEGFGGLVVHAPLLALLLLELPRRHAPDRPLSVLDYRAHRAVFVDDPCLVVGTPDAGGAELAVLGPDGEPRMTATAGFVTPVASGPGDRRPVRGDEPGRQVEVSWWRRARGL